MEGKKKVEKQAPMKAQINGIPVLPVSTRFSRIEGQTEAGYIHWAASIKERKQGFV